MKVPFIRIAPTTLFQAPSCYGYWKDGCDNQTVVCPVRDACVNRQPVIIREVEVNDNGQKTD